MASEARCGCQIATVQNISVPGREYQEQVLDPRGCRWRKGVEDIRTLLADSKARRDSYVGPESDVPERWDIRVLAFTEALTALGAEEE